LIADVASVLKNTLRYELSYIKKPHQNQKFVSVVKKCHINGVWIMIMTIIVLGAGSVNLAILG
jgi:hypothetical protein